MQENHQNSVPPSTPVSAPTATGTYVPDMAIYDRILTQLMTKWKIPGGAVAVVKDGRLVLARGYGLADIEQNETVKPDSLFRLASLSKTITAAAVLKLVEGGKLDLDAKAFRLLDHLSPPAGKTADSRIYNVTIRHLLQHSGGWNIEDFDPVERRQRVAREMGTPEPISSDIYIRFMLGQPLDFNPGSQDGYSNFGYNVLGRVIEKVTGQTYYDYVKSQVLEPAGITSMRPGRALLKDRYEGEVRYYDYEGAPTVRSMFPDSAGLVPQPYGGVNMETANGGWISSAIDLVRFVTALGNARILKSGTLTTMTSRPAPPLWTGSSYYRGLGWWILLEGAGADWFHTGGMPGTRTIVVRKSTGLAFAALFNSRPKDVNAFTGELRDALTEAERGVTKWPSHDLFR